MSRRWIETFLTTAFVAADLDDDGDLDLVVAFNHWQEAAVRSFLNQGDGTFETETPLISPLNGGGQVMRLVAADLDGDGDVDIAGTDVTSLMVLLNQDGVNFSLSRLEIGIDEAPRRLIAADIDDDGLVDLFGDNSRRQFYWLFRNAGGGGFPEAEVAKVAINGASR